MFRQSWQHTFAADRVQGYNFHLMLWRRNVGFRCAVYVILLLSTALCLGQTAVYFPERVLGDDAWEEKFKVDWYSKFLTALDEPSLWQSSKIQKNQTYRFLWLRSFHHPVSVRLDAQSDGTALVTVKIASGQGGYEPGKIIENRTKKLNREQARSFLNLVDELKFWSLPTNPPKDPNLVTDGAHWVLEGVRDAHYHVLDRWSPDKGEVRTLGLEMLTNLAGLKLRHRDVY